MAFAIATYAPPLHMKRVSRMSIILGLASLPALLANCSSEDAPDVYRGDLSRCVPDPGGKAPPFAVDSSKDPMRSPAQFSLERALEGMPAGQGKLLAVISTEFSEIRCELFEKTAPTTVANFVGLARGTRPYKKENSWTTSRFYDGLLWHRIVPNFIVQGGDPTGMGDGGPGYLLPLENQVSLKKGALAMAGSGNGSQFFVVVGESPDAFFNVFGRCTTENAQAMSYFDHGQGETPILPLHMHRIDLYRCP